MHIFNLGIDCISNFSYNQNNKKIPEAFCVNDDFFQALASPYRREIIRLLKWKTLSAGEIADQFDISQPSVSRHLDILKRAGIVTAERRANQIFYSLNLSVLQEFLVEAAALFGPKEEPADEKG